MSIGYDNTTNTIWLIGGAFAQNSLISFNLSIWNETNAFTDYGENILPYSIANPSQAYVQRESIVYVVGATNQALSLYAFDVSTGSLNIINTNPSSYTLDIGSCLAAIRDWIIFTHTNKTYILTISNQSWKLTGNPLMLEERKYHSCMIEPDGGYLYVIAGLNASRNALKSIEKLSVKDMKNIDQYNFTTLDNTLAISGSNALGHAILYKTYIYVVSGLRADDIHMIDTTTDTISVWGALSGKFAYTTSIIIDERVYIFGGSIIASRERVRLWQYFDAFSICLIHMEYIHIRILLK